MQKIENPPITTKQKEILLQLYRFRYLKPKQLQKILRYRSNSKIYSRLEDLREKNYVRSHQLPSSGSAKAPSVYYTGKYGIASLRARSDTTETVLRRLRRDRRVGKEFIEGKLLAADIASELDDSYEIATSSSIANPKSTAHWIYQMGLDPDLIVVSQSDRVYLVEVLSPSVPGYVIRKRAKLYLEARELTDWDLRIIIVSDNRVQKGIAHRILRKAPERGSCQIVLRDEANKINWD